MSMRHDHQGQPRDTTAPATSTSRKDRLSLPPSLRWLPSHHCGLLPPPAYSPSHITSPFEQPPSPSSSEYSLVSLISLFFSSLSSPLHCHTGVASLPLLFNSGRSCCSDTMATTEAKKNTPPFYVPCMILE
ncbi:hypothetical protein M758_UG262900 [Ceratodon purpureus]|nr:hypothetical protein M758_UG262900 [Ceratodon purpureus]